MQKIVLDTNVIISALIGKSAPWSILYELVFTKKVQLCLSDEVFAEYVEVLGRDKFSKIVQFKHNAEIVLSMLNEISFSYTPNTKIAILTDVDDNKFLELAVAASADYLITGNSNDFIIASIENTKIVSPKDYWDNFKP